jgi:hypothetical protein
MKVVRRTEGGDRRTVAELVVDLVRDLLLASESLIVQDLDPID